MFVLINVTSELATLPPLLTEADFASKLTEYQTENQEQLKFLVGNDDVWFLYYNEKELIPLVEVY